MLGYSPAMHKRASFLLAALACGTSLLPVIAHAQAASPPPRSANPPIRVAPAYRYKTVRYCIPGDTICNGSPVGGPNALHVLYTVNGMTIDAANYVARRL